MAYITRIVDDINSDFYYLKERCLCYLSSFVEGLDYDITTFMASNINPDSVFNLMISLIKKLALFYRLKESNSLKRKVNDAKRRATYDAGQTSEQMMGPAFSKKSDNFKKSQTSMTQSQVNSL